MPRTNLTDTRSKLSAAANDSGLRAANHPAPAALSALAALAGLAAVAASVLLALPRPCLAQSAEKAKVTAAVANTRSGPGDYWYVTGQVKRGQTVTVVSEQNGWAEILAPDKHHSLILKSSVDAQGGRGRVIGNAPAAVRAGEVVPGKRRSRIQLYLNPGPTSEVSILGAADSYYLITPPAGATVFVKADLLDRGSTATTDTNTGAATNTNNNVPPQIATQPDTSTATTTTGQRTVVPPAISTQPEPAEMTMADVRAMVAADQNSIRQLLAKPLLDRDYSVLLKRFEDLKAANVRAPVRGMDKYADAMIAWVSQQQRLQDMTRQMATTRPADIDKIIEDARRQVVPTPPQPAYQATGILRKSQALAGSAAMPRLHKLEAVDGGKVICYLLPGAADDWTAIEGKQVEVTGRREYRGDWNFYVVHPERVTVVGGGEVITSKTIEPTGVGVDTPPDITPLLPGNIFVDTPPGPSSGPDATTPPEPSSEAGKTTDPGGLDLLPADPPVAPLPELRPVVPDTQPN